MREGREEVRQIVFLTPLVLLSCTVPLFKKKNVTKETGRATQQRIHKKKKKERILELLAGGESFRFALLLLSLRFLFLCGWRRRLVHWPISGGGASRPAGAPLTIILVPLPRRGWHTFEERTRHNTIRHNSALAIAISPRLLSLFNLGRPTSTRNGQRPPRAFSDAHAPRAAVGRLAWCE